MKLVATPVTTRSKRITSIDSLSRANKNPNRNGNTPSPNTSAEIAPQLGFNPHVHRGVQHPHGKIVKSHVVEIFGREFSQISGQLVS